MAQTESTVHVRPYNPDMDYDVVVRVFRETIGDNLHFEPAHTLSTYAWCRPYLLLSPSTCFVLSSSSSDGTSCSPGEPVGFILGTPSTMTFAQRWRISFLASVDRMVCPEPAIPDGDERGWDLNWDDDPVGTLQRVIWGPERYPAHLHIDILPAYQRKGCGGQLMTVFLQKVKEEGASGCHIIMPASNIDARRFYGRHGFRMYEKSMNDGGSGEPGILKDGSVCLVREL
ncbi:hypothetical protein BU26DRAFT_433080 [Trematosphaeria pertusa]|uniref:N-acetyltransferase domain-containing protein n=1 Tax=Trematosphaeria pertusa TaxID=390896 RepID=A0A6A6I5Q3_9PLEO|nr:uncharacterized protein BU26DRAFT_433080 [Trematosphaeria pertusa]KAF2245282.1 hypothetical protein BU26DRAFT_433080 [Trematosphaeria pertusa]